MLDCNAVTVGYEDHCVASGVSFTLAPKEIVALLGPNGGGKSTILKTISGLLPKFGGCVLIDGVEIEELSVREIARKIAFVPQEEAWQFDFTVEEVVSMGRIPVSNGFFDTQEDHIAAVGAMEEADCLQLRSRRVTELSGGERQRVLIARALAQEAPILLLDEPTSHLDPKHQVGTAKLLKRLAKKGKCILVAIHDLTLAAAVADKGILVSGGTASAAMPMAKLMESDELDKAYGVDFQRISTPDGKLLVMPKS